MPEFDTVEVRLHKSTDQDVCYKASSEKVFQQEMAKKGYITTEDYIEDNKKSSHTGRPVVYFEKQTCRLLAQDVEVNISVIPQGPHVIGWCGAAPNLAGVAFSSGKEKIFSGDLGNVCGNNISREIRSVHYTVSRNAYGETVQKQVTTRGYDGKEPYEETINLMLEIE